MGEIHKLEQEQDQSLSDGFSSWKWCWWNPPQDKLPTEFFNETSLHGLQYIGQPQRHITERVFWFLIFIIGVVAAVILTYLMFQRYEDTPVIVSFKSKEQTIDTLPFPALTICNINPISRRKVLELERIANDPEHEKSKEAENNLTMIGSFCTAQATFAQDNGYAYHRGLSVLAGQTTGLVDFLVENTVPCEEMIRLCKFQGVGHTFECAEIFKPVVREHGICCTFNMLPLPMIYQNPSNIGKENSSIFDNPALGTKMQWDDDEIREWSRWNYDDTFLLPTIYIPEEREPDYDIPLLPFRQIQPGKRYGLSLLLDFNIDDYHCPVLDSKGMLFTLHTPLEVPHVLDFPSVLDTNKEIFVNVQPDITYADPDIRDLSSEKRQCYFGTEKKLKLYVPYTKANCIDDCVNNKIAEKCGCGFFHMPRDEGVPVCSLPHQECYDSVLLKLRYTKQYACGHCLPLCDDISYRFETTSARLQNASTLWYDGHREEEVPEWANHSMSIVHIFFGSSSIVPKLRKRLYGITDLIANTGGILGLCLGFSMLSAAEIIYFASVRAFMKYIRGRKSKGSL